MENTHKNPYKTAMLSLLAGECPPDFDPDVEDLEIHCQDHCVPADCYKSWMEGQEGTPVKCTVEIN